MVGVSALAFEPVERAGVEAVSAAVLRHACYCRQ